MLGINGQDYGIAGGGQAPPEQSVVQQYLQATSPRSLHDATHLRWLSPKLRLCL